MNKKFHFDTLSIAIINIILCSFFIPYLISLILNMLKLSFFHLIMVGWIPGGLGAIYVLYRFFKQCKTGEYSILKGMIAAVLSLMMIIFTVMLIFSAGFHFYNVHTAVSQIETEYYPVSIVVDVEKTDYYFENEDGKYYCYHEEDGSYDENDNYAKTMETFKQAVVMDDDGSYYIVK